MTGPTVGVPVRSTIEIPYCCCVFVSSLTASALCAEKQTDITKEKEENSLKCDPQLGGDLVTSQKNKRHIIHIVSIHILTVILILVHYITILLRVLRTSDPFSCILDYVPIVKPSLGSATTDSGCLATATDSTQDCSAC